MHGSGHAQSMFGGFEKTSATFVILQVSPPSQGMGILQPVLCGQVALGMSKGKHQ